MAEEEEEPQGDDVPASSGGGGVQLVQPGLEDAEEAQEGCKTPFSKRSVLGLRRCALHSTRWTAGDLNVASLNPTRASNLEFEFMYQDTLDVLQREQFQVNVCVNY